MFKAIGQLFASLCTLFSALEKGASSIDHLASIAEAEAAGLAEQMTAERQARFATLVKQLKAA